MSHMHAPQAVQKANHKRAKAQRGVTIVEAGLLVALVAVVVIASTKMLGIGVKNMSCEAVNGIIGDISFLPIFVSNKDTGTCSVVDSSGELLKWYWE
jgi:Flp pilus assembly pilin Flp